MFSRRGFLRLAAGAIAGLFAGKVVSSATPGAGTEEEPVWRYSSMGIVAELEEETGWVCNSIWRSSRGPPDWSTTSSLERAPVTEEQASEGWFPGTIDNVIISDRALSPAEIIELDMDLELSADDPLVKELVSRLSSLGWEPMGSGEIIQAGCPEERGGLTQEQWERCTDPTDEGIWAAHFASAG